jgi:hypothetical protein
VSGNGGFACAIHSQATPLHRKGDIGVDLVKSKSLIGAN